MSPGHKELFQDILKKPAVNPKKARVGQFDSLGFSKNVSSREKLKPFLTFDIIISHIFSEHFIGIPQVIQKM